MKMVRARGISRNTEQKQKKEEVILLLLFFVFKKRAFIYFWFQGRNLYDFSTES